MSRVKSKAGSDSCSRYHKECSQSKRSLSEIDTGIGCIGEKLLRRCPDSYFNVKTLHARPCFFHLSPLCQPCLWQSHRRPEEPEPGLEEIRLAAEASNLSSSGHEPCNLSESPAAAAGRQQGRGQPEAAIWGKQSYKAVIIRGERRLDRERGPVCWQEARLQIDPLLCSWTGLPAATRHQAEGRGRQPAQYCTSRLLNLRPPTFLELAKEFQQTKTNNQQTKPNQTNKQN